MCKCKHELHFALFGYVSLWPLTSMKRLITHKILESLGRLANNGKIAIGIYLLLAPIVTTLDFKITVVYLM